VQFAADFGAAELRAVVCAGNEDQIPHALSVYVQVPFCRSPCFYCGCTRIITRDGRRADINLEHLLREIELTAPLFDRDRRVVQLHPGGGTPSFLDSRQMTTRIDSLRPAQRGMLLDDDDVIRADAISRITRNGALDVRALEQRHGIDFNRYFADELQRMCVLEGEGRVALTAQRIEVSARARFLLRIVGMCFDAFLGAQSTPATHYSRTR